MRLIRGAPGSGKTALVFRQFKQALSVGQREIRIVVPTATLVRHFQHELARDGAVFPPGLVVSLNRFIAERTPESKLVPETLLRAIVQDCLQRLNLPEFSEVSGTAGMVSLILDTLKLFENAACTPDRLSAARRLSPQARAFEKLWRAIESGVTRAGYQTRVAVIRAAAANGQPPQRIWMDGFITFSLPEGELIRALAKNCDLTLTLTDSRATDDIRKLALQLGAEDHLLAGPLRKPRITISEARTPEREADEIARRILELNRQGTPFRKIGIALPETSAWLPLLRTTLDRFGVPARFYFPTSLRSHPVAVFLGGLISGALEGREFASAIETLRAHPKWGQSPGFDRFDFAVREAMPGRGSENLLALCEEGGFRDALEECFKTDEWKNRRHPPAEWILEFERLAGNLYRPGVLDPPRDHSGIAIARSHVAGLRSWRETIESVADFWPDKTAPISLAEFWRVASSALAGAVLRTGDDRSDVVHVMSVPEARQWDVAALFVCGMVDRDFPRRHSQNLLFPDAEIDRLRLPLRKASEQENDEQWLFESLRTRATERLVLSYPLHDAAGKSAEKSRFLIDLGPVQPARACRPEGETPREPRLFSARIESPDLLTEMARLHQSISTTSLEDLAQCRFKFFAAKTLRLKGSPDSPGERLQPLVTGSIMHHALERWLGEKNRDFVAVFEETFDEVCRKEHIPPGYRLEVERIAFREIAKKIRANDRWTTFSSEMEKKLTLQFPNGITVNCRIDRIDKLTESGDECVIIDYKSSKTERVEQLVESRTRLQAPLYALAVREQMKLNPVAVLYWAVRDDKPFGWGRIPGTNLEFSEMPSNWAVDARDRTVDRLASFLEGAVGAHPEEQDKCRWCDFKDVCRVEQRQALVMIEGAHGA